MAKDADGNYYYEEGTVAEEMENWDMYEDSDGNIGFYDGSNEMRMHPLGKTFGGQRAEPTTSDLADGEYMYYVSDGDGANSAGDFVVARNNGGSIETNVVGAASGFA